MLKTKASQDENKPRSVAFFWWFLANVLALCFAVNSWIFVLYIFQNPEIPRNYKILQKLGREPELQIFSNSNLPKGEGYDPKDLYKVFSNLKGDPLDLLNRQLLRNYLQNFTNNNLLTFVEGTYRVIDSKPIGRAHLFPSGFAVRAQALVNTDRFSEPVVFPLLIDCIYSTENSSLSEKVSKGDLIELSKNSNAYAVLNVSKTMIHQDQVLLLTVTPVLDKSQSLGNVEPFQVQAPDRLNVGAGISLWEQ